MDNSVSDFVEQMKTPTNKFTLKELREREDVWRGLWSWIPEDVKYLLYRIGTQVRILRRDYKGSLGKLGEIRFEPKEYEISVFEKHYNETDGKYYYEKKVIKIPSSAVMMLEFIQERIPAETLEKEEVMSLEGIEDPS